MRQTNPVPGPACGRGIPTIPLFYYSTITGGGLSCQTKPIGLSRAKGAVRGTHPANRDQSCETKPISSVGQGPGGRNAQNRPNSSIAGFGLWIADSGQPYGGTPPAGRRARGRVYNQTQFDRAICAKQTQTWASWGIWGDGAPGRANGAKRTQFCDRGFRTDLRRESTCSLPPGPRRANCAKRTQFPAAEIPLHSSIPSFRHASRKPSVQNEPNWARAGPGASRPVGRGVLYKKTQFRPLCQSGDRRSREGQACETRRARQKSGSTEPTRDIGPETRVETNSATFVVGVKQSQFLRPAGVSHHCHIPAFQYPSPISIVQNEPNSARPGQGRAPGRRKMRDEPNSLSAARGRVGRIVPPKANWPV
jgi:hypothetical protein